MSIWGLSQRNCCYAMSLSLSPIINPLSTSIPVINKLQTQYHIDDNDIRHTIFPNKKYETDSDNSPDILFPPKYQFDDELLDKNEFDDEQKYQHMFEGNDGKFDKLHALLHEKKFQYLRNDVSEEIKVPLYIYIFCFIFALPANRYL